MAIKIQTVEPGSPAQQLGLGPGGGRLSVAGHTLHDRLDYGV